MELNKNSNRPSYTCPPTGDFQNLGAKQIRFSLFNDIYSSISDDMWDYMFGLMILPVVAQTRDQLGDKVYLVVKEDIRNE